MNKWILYNFRIKWPEGEEQPQTWIDFIISDTIIRDVIEKKGSEIECWRIHRRWDSKEKKDHILAFHVYICDSVSNEIDLLIKENPFFVLLNEEGLFEKYEIEDNNITDYHGNGEGYWSPLIQKTFPLYIQGICETFFDMIQKTRQDDLGIGFSNVLLKEIPQIEEIYKKIEFNVAKAWQLEGNYLLHHFNAILGYGPVFINL